jgi:hypothetical protein
MEIQTGKENANSVNIRFENVPAHCNTPANEIMEILTSPQPSSDFNLNPYYKIVEELEKWKACQEVKFLQQVSRKAQLDQLSTVLGCVVV